MKKFIFIFTALPLFAFAEDKYNDNQKFIDDIENTCHSITSCIDTFNKYFKMLKDKCVYSDGYKECYYKLSEPVTLTGTLTYIIDYNVEACGPGKRYTIFVPNDKDFSFLIGQQYKGAIIDKTFKDIEKMLPKWFKETRLAGRVSFKVKLTINNEKILNFQGKTISAGLKQDINDCNEGEERLIFPTSIKILNKISEQKSGLSSYISVYSMVYYTLNTAYDYVNIRQTPNGKLLSKIYKSNIDNIVIVDLDQARSNLFDKKSTNEWVQVVYFPDKEDEENFIVGYIHKSQIKQIEDIYKFLNNGE